MGKRMGENITAEWLHDAEADKVWDALQLIRTDPENGIEALLHIAENQSSLALMFLGNIYSKGEYLIPKNIDLGKTLLQKSLEKGSIEGGYILANILMSEKKINESLNIYNDLSDLNYAPAKYVLGYHYVFSEYGSQDLNKGLGFFEDAARLGHFPSKRTFANLLITKRRGLFDVPKGIFLKIFSVFPYLYFYLTYPNSDRLRV